MVCVTRALSWRIHANSVGVRLAIDTGAVTVGASVLPFCASLLPARAPAQGKTLNLACPLNTFLTVCGG